jgi:hypothetical protein
VTEEALQYNLAERQRRMRMFQQKPENYKICEQCNSVVWIKSKVCQVCACYRFDETREGVLRIAAILGTNPFPLTAGVVPRY